VSNNAILNTVMSFRGQTVKDQHRDVIFELLGWPHNMLPSELYIYTFLFRFLARVWLT